MYIYPVEYYIAIKRKEIILLAAIWTGLGIIILSEGSQTGKDKYDTSEVIYKTETDV